MQKAPRVPWYEWKYPLPNGFVRMAAGPTGRVRTTLEYAGEVLLSW